MNRRKKLQIVVGLLPNVLAKKFARVERYGLMILIGLLIVLPLLGAQLGMNLNFVSQLISVTANAVIQTILRLTGNTLGETADGFRNADKSERNRITC